VSGRGWLETLDALPEERRAVVDRMVGEILRSITRDIAAYKAALAVAPEVTGFGMGDDPSGPNPEDFRANIAELVDRLIAEDPDAAEVAFNVVKAIIDERFRPDAGD
jgi:hypothetical protein